MSPTPTPSLAAPGSTPASGPVAVPSVATASPAPEVQLSPAPGSTAGGAFPWVLLDAIVTAWLAVWTARRKSREEQRARQRTLFAEAYEAYALYKEMPYAIRRRRHDDLPGERVRLSETIQEIQGKISFYKAWIVAELTTVGAAYSLLVAELRKVASGAMREA